MARGQEPRWPQPWATALPGVAAQGADGSGAEIAAGHPGVPACACRHRCPVEKPRELLCPAGPGWEQGQIAASPHPPERPGTPREPPRRLPGREMPEPAPDPAGKGRARSGGCERRSAPDIGQAPAEHPPAGGGAPGPVPLPRAPPGSPGIALLPPPDRAGASL